MTPTASKRRRRFRGRGWRLLGLAVAAYAASVAAAATSRAQPRVTVYAAASLAEAFGALGTVLEQRTPPVRVTFNFAGSQQLATQLEQGAPADVFASADERWMADVRGRGLLAGVPREFARNHLAVIVPATNPGHVAVLQDLANPGTKVVLGAEAVPVGRYSREVLGKLNTTAGFGADYAERVLRNVVSNEENVKSVVAKVQLGEADAGMVYRSDVTPAVAPQVRMLAIPDADNVLASYPVAILRDAPHAAGATAFVKLLLSAQGQAVLGAHGLLPVAER